MRIDMDEAQRPVLAPHRPQDRQHDGVVAAERQRPAAMREDLVIGRLDDVDALLKIEGVDGDVADIGDRQAVEGRRARGHVVGPDQAAFGANLARPEARAGPVGGAGVERHAHEAGIQTLRARQARQAHHGRRAAEARHLVAAERLVVNLLVDHVHAVPPVP